MTGNALYSQLLKSLYAVPEGADADFLSDLATAIPFSPKEADWPMSGPLAQIPSRLAAGLQTQIQWHEQSIAELREEALSEDEDFDFGEATFENMDQPTLTTEVFWGLQDGLQELRDQLADL